MITFVRQADSVSGKLGEAMAFAHEIATLSSRIIGNEVKVMTPVGGPADMIGWFATFEDLSAFGAAFGKLSTNQDYLEALKKAHGLFVDGATHDQIWHQA